MELFISLTIHMSSRIHHTRNTTAALLHVFASAPMLIAIFYLYPY